MTPEKRQEWKEHIRVWRKYVKDTAQWLKESEVATLDGGTTTPPPTPPPADNPPGKPPNP